MRKIIIAGLCITALILYLVMPVLSAGVTITEETFGTMKKITASWISNASGAASETTTEYYSGVVYRTVFVPGATTPSDAYDVTIKDDDDVDILDGGGTDLSNSSTDQLQGILGVSAVANCQLDIDITNADSGKTGTIVIYLR